LRVKIEDLFKISTTAPPPGRPLSLNNYINESLRNPEDVKTAASSQKLAARG